MLVFSYFDNGRVYFFQEGQNIFLEEGKTLKHLAIRNRYTKKALKLFTEQYERATTYKVITFNYRIGELQVKTFHQFENNIWRGENVRVINLNKLQCTCGR